MGVALDSFRIVVFGKHVAWLELELHVAAAVVPVVCAFAVNGDADLFQGEVSTRMANLSRVTAAIAPLLDPQLKSLWCPPTRAEEMRSAEYMNAQQSSRNCARAWPGESNVQKVPEKRRLSSAKKSLGQLEESFHCTSQKIVARKTNACRLRPIKRCENCSISRCRKGIENSTHGGFFRARTVTNAR